MGKYSRLGKNTLLVFVGNMGSKLISLLMLPFYTAWLSVADYGVTDLVLVYVSFLLSIVTFCLADAVFIFPKGQSKDLQKKYFSSGFFIATIGLGVTALLFYLIQLYLVYIKSINSFTEYVWIIYFILVASFLQSYTQQFSRSLDKITVYAISGVVLTASTAILSFLLIPRYKLNGYFLAQIISLILSSIYTFFASKSYQYLSLYSLSKKYYKEMLHYSIPLIPNGVMWWVVSGLNRPIMEKYLGLQEIGLFAVANKFPSVIAILFSVFIYSWQISVLEEFSKEGYAKFYNKVLHIVFSLLILLSCGMAIFSPLIISIVVDAKFTEASKFIPLLSLGAVFSSFSGMIGANFSAVRKSKYYFYSSAWGALGSIVLSFILIPLYGLYGACLAVIGSLFLMTLARLKYSWQYVHLDNIYKYIIMIVINVLLILSLSFVKDLVYSYFSIIFLIILYIAVNRSLFLDLKIVLQNRRKLK